MIKAASVDLDVDLQPLSKLLWQKGVQHRIAEESGKQVVWVADQQQASYVKQLAEALRSGSIELKVKAPQAASPSLTNPVSGRSGMGVKLISGISSVFRIAPVTFVLIFICLLVALVTRLGNEPMRLAYLFYPTLPYDSLPGLLGGITSVSIFLRTLAPMFLHFGELHIIFNLLWLWYFGRQLETVQSSNSFLLLVVFTSFAANSTQYLYSQASNFGGMSGVVYGLVGYAWVLHNFVPGKRLMLNNSLFFMFIIALVLMEMVASSMIATGAHIGGLVAGMLAGLVMLAAVKLKNQSGVN